MSTLKNHSTKTQCALILQHLLEGKTLTALEAIHAPFSCINLSGRIADLRKEGWPIESPRDTVASGKSVAFYQFSKEYLASRVAA